MRRRNKRLPVKAASPVGRRGDPLGAARLHRSLDRQQVAQREGAMRKRARKAAEPKDKSRTVVGRLKPEQTPEAATAEMTVEGVGHNVVTAAEFSKCFYSEPDLTELMVAQTLAIEAVHKGDLKGAEALLSAQAGTLNAIFTNMAFQSYKAKIFDHADRYMRLALKAQSQCRATCETLAVLKNPPVFARQANIASGAQLVNNGTIQQPSRAGNLETGQIELLEQEHGERLDLGSAGTAGAGDKALATVGAFDRPADRGR